MTNKLRSVIDNKINACKGIYGFFPKDDRTNDQEICVKVELVELLIQDGLEEVLDAIIEELEEQRWRTTKNSYNSAQNELIDFFTEKLKQAREELSTSLTQ